MKLIGLRNSDASAGIDPAGSGQGKAGHGRTRKRRFLSAVLLFGLFTVFTKPGRSLSRTVARWLDSRLENFADPGSSAYAHVFAPFLGQLYRRVAEDAAGELVERGLRRIEQDRPAAHALADHASSRGGRPSDMVSTG